MNNLTLALNEINNFSEIHCVSIRILFEWLGYIRIEMYRDEFKITRSEKISMFSDNLDAVRVILENMVREIDMHYPKPIILPLAEKAETKKS